MSKLQSQRQPERALFKSKILWVKCYSLGNFPREKKRQTAAWNETGASWRAFKSRELVAPTLEHSHNHQRLQHRPGSDDERSTERACPWGRSWAMEHDQGFVTSMTGGRDRGRNYVLHIQPLYSCCYRRCHKTTKTISAAPYLLHPWAWTINVVCDVELLSCLLAGS